MLDMWYQYFLSFTETTTYSKRIENVVLCFGVVVLAVILYIVGDRRRRKLPPGPIGLPIFGYYFSLRKNPMKKAEELTKKYGNVFGLYIGPKYVVFLNDWNAVKDALSQSGTIDRPHSTFGEVPYKLGVAGVNGEEWVEVRRLSSRAMKDGLHKNNWEDLIEEEASEMVKCILQEGDNPIEVRNFFCDSFSNNIVTLVLGERLSLGHPITKMVSKSVDYILEYSPTFGMLNFSTTLAKFLQMLGIEKESQLAQKLQEFSTFLSDTVDKKIQNPNEGVKDTFISRFQREIDSYKKTKEKSYVTVDSMKGTIMALMTGGAETTRTITIWALIAMADHPEEQRKVHEELDRVIGKDGSIRWADRYKVPYTYAAILESMRWTTAGPFPVMRITTEDIQIQGYNIPKGTFIVSNISSLHNDPRYWENPEKFIPERFLTEDGRKVNASPESYNPFSYGKRNCPGKLLALMETLQYFSSLMQKFKVIPKEGDKVKYDGVLRLSYQARNCELRFIPRT